LPHEFEKRQTHLPEGRGYRNFLSREPQFWGVVSKAVPRWTAHASSTCAKRNQSY